MSRDAVEEDNRMRKMMMLVAVAVACVLIAGPLYGAVETRSALQGDNIGDDPGGVLLNERRESFG